MKHILITLLVFVTLSGSAKQVIPAKLIKRGSPDTLNVTIQVRTSLLYPDIIDELSFKGALFIFINEEKQKVKEEDVDCLVFVDLKGKRREFVSDRFINFLDMGGILLEKMYVGKISWYRDYTYQINAHNPYQHADYFINSRSVSPGVNPKRELKFRTTDMPELLPKIKKIKTDEDILAILKQYNEGTAGTDKK